MTFNRLIILLASTCLAFVVAPYLPAVGAFIMFYYMMQSSVDRYTQQHNLICIDKSGHRLANTMSKKEQKNFRVYKNSKGAIRIGLKNEILEPGDTARTLVNFTEPQTISAVPALSQSTVLKTLEGHRIIYSDTGVDETWSQTGVFSEGLVPVKIGTRWGYADINGKVIIDAAYERASSFKNGYSIVETKEYP